MRRALPIVAVAAVAALLADDAWGRVGGGQSYSSGGGGGGSYSGGGGGGGGEAELLFFLVRLVILYPQIGVPLLLLFLGFLVVRARMDGGRGDVHVHRTHHHPGPARKARADVEALRERDPGFSVPVFVDFAQLVHRRATEALGTGDWEPLAPFVAASARSAMVAGHPGVTRVSEVVLAGATIERIELSARETRLRVKFLGSRVEHRGADERRVYVEERWVFRRAADATSLPPEDMLRMGCPACGAAVDTDEMGRCTHCGTPITTGALQWQAISWQPLARREVQAPQVGFTSGGAEPSVHVPTVYAPDLGAAFRRFTSRHPDFDVDAFQGRVRHIYHALQEAWSDATWEKARPYVTDPMFQTLRFWMDGYVRAGLRNRLDDVRLDSVEIVKVDLDAWYESITVRIHGGMKDYVVDERGEVVGGNARRLRRFSEYWTFLRSAGTGARPTDPDRCPSCGAPLDNVNQAGVCGYCDTRITSGRFDWVLSRIDQPDAYQG